MTAATAHPPLWLSIESKIADLGASDFESGAKETTVHQLAETLDGEGYNVSRHAGNMLMLRRAVDARASVGRPFMTDFEAAKKELTLDDVVNPIHATATLVRKVGAEWPEFQNMDRRAGVQAIVEAVRLDLLLAKANEIGGDKGVRYLIEHEVEEPVILDRLGIDQAKLDAVKAAIAAELAEIARVEKLLKEVEDQDEQGRVRHLVDKDVADESIVEIAGIDQKVIDEVKKAMEAELAEKARLAAEAEAAKKAAAEGPKLEDISSDDMLSYIEDIREIMEFSDDPAEIATMCEQSNIPKALIEIATENPDKLDELEAAAEG
jgi:hypothetical protein